MLLKTTKNRFSIRRMSIKQRLPLLIFLLLVSLLIAFSLASYIGVEKASFAVAEQRLTQLTGQLSKMFEISTKSLSDAAQATANQDVIKKVLSPGGEQYRDTAQAIINKLRQDTLFVDVELLDAQKKPVLWAAKNDKRININIDSFLHPATTQSSTPIGKFFSVDTSIYYPIAVAVIDSNKVKGYLVKWRLLRSTHQAIEQLGQIIGANGRLYFGNADGVFWTDMLKPVNAPPIDIHNINKVVEYSRQPNEPLFATAYEVPHSEWLILVEISKKTFLATPALFLQWTVIIGIALIIIGSFIAWRMSRNITIPLKSLTAAATGVAQGDYTNLPDINRQDELGQLAEAFNIMVAQVREMQKNLEQKVQDRTFELENSNKELEAFSYSVSHDLHAPLRIIDGYAAILTEKAAGKLDEDSTKILGHIRNKTKRMGTLIDELLNLSYLGRKEPETEMVDMDAIVRAVIKEQLFLNTKPVNINIKNLLPAMCDSTLIRQVWSNLISNAIKYSARKTHPCIEIDSIKRDGVNVYSIKDNGVGFDMKYAGKLFNVFQRLHGLKEFEGSGVGLALVQRVVARHGGTVWAEAEEGKGATFYFTLPV